MLGIGTLVAIACLKQPMLFQNPGTMWRDKLCVLFKKNKKGEKLCAALCPHILVPFAFHQASPAPFRRVRAEIFFRAYGISAALLRKFTSALTEIPLPLQASRTGQAAPFPPQSPHGMAGSVRTADRLSPRAGGILFANSFSRKASIRTTIYKNISTWLKETLG